MVNLLSTDDKALVDFAVGMPMPLAGLPAHLFGISDSRQRALLGERSTPPLGMDALRTAIAGYYTRQGCPTEPEQILVTSGAQQAIALCVNLFVQRGDAVLLESPSYFGALEVLRRAGARMVGLTMGAQHIDPGQLRDLALAHRPQMVYLSPSFHNPTGLLMPEPARRAVARIVRELGVTLVEDGTTADFAFDGVSPPPIATFAGGGALLSIGSMDKLFWGGLRVGWLRGPVSLIRKLSSLKSTWDLHTSVVTQTIATQLLTACDQAIALRRTQLRARRDMVVELLQEHLPAWQCDVPAGGLFLWVTLPSGDSRALAQIAARHGVAITPGTLFSLDESHVAQLRIPFLLEEPLLRLGVERLAAAWREYVSGGQRWLAPEASLV